MHSYNREAWAHSRRLRKTSNSRGNCSGYATWFIVWVVHMVDGARNNHSHILKKSCIDLQFRIPKKKTKKKTKVENIARLTNCEIN